MDKDTQPIEPLTGDNLARLFTRLGGRFILSPDGIASKLRQIRTLVFDWDGVFNTGLKGNDFSSTFSEPDSMGTNMLRYGLWRSNKQLPVAGIITGAHNQAAVEFARREHFHVVYVGVKDKRLAIHHLMKTHQIEADQIACAYDDINDLGMAAQCGLRFMVHRAAGPLFNNYVIRRNLCDYITASSSQNTPVREISELALGLMGIFETVVDSRVNWDEAYQAYYNQRQTIPTRFYTQDVSEIVPCQIDP